MKKYLVDILIISVFLIGLSLLLYPTVSDYINARNSSKVIADYESNITNASAERIAQIFEEADAYNQNLAATTASLYDPSKVKGYYDVLDPIGAGIMGYLDIERIGVQLPIYHGVSEGVLQIGVGHMEGTSLPIGGENTHCVFSGHRGLPSAKLFTDLDEMQTGDIFTITVMNRLLTYQVDQIKVVLPTETDDLQLVAGKDYCTLVTCTPYGVNTHRLLVRGVRIDNPEIAPTIYVSNEAFRIEKLIVLTVVAVPMLSLLLIFLLIRSIVRIVRRKTSDKKEGNEHETT